MSYDKLFFAVALGNNRFANWAEYQKCADDVRCSICDDFANFAQSRQDGLEAEEQNPSRDEPQASKHYSKKHETDCHNIND